MSKVGKMHINVPSTVKVSVNGKTLHFEGANGKRDYDIPEGVEVKIDNNVINFGCVGEMTKELNSIWGTTRANVNNIIRGLDKLFEKKIEFVGVGYRASVAGKNIEMKLGFSHDVVVEIPEGIKVTAEKPTLLNFKCADNQMLGNFLRKLQLFRRPEPYKGKGLIIDNQYVYRKEGKKK